MTKQRYRVEKIKKLASAMGNYCGVTIEKMEIIKQCNKLLAEMEDDEDDNRSM